MQLHEPDGHTVVDTKIPKGMHRQLRLIWHTVDAFLRLSPTHRCTEVTTNNRAVPLAVVFLIHESVGFLGALATGFKALNGTFPNAYHLLWGKHWRILSSKD